MESDDFNLKYSGQRGPPCPCPCPFICQRGRPRPCQFTLKPSPGPLYQCGLEDLTSWKKTCQVNSLMIVDWTGREARNFGDGNQKSAPDGHWDRNPNRSKAEFTEGKSEIRNPKSKILNLRLARRSAFAPCPAAKAKKSGQRGPPCPCPCPFICQHGRPRPCQFTLKPSPGPLYQCGLEDLTSWKKTCQVNSLMIVDWTGREARNFGDGNQKSAPDGHWDRNPNRSKAEFTEGKSEIRNLKFSISGWRAGLHLLARTSSSVPCPAAKAKK